MSDLVYLAHHGIKGQEHGHRRFQNYDGSLTPAGRERYGVGPARKAKQALQTVGNITKKSVATAKKTAAAAKKTAGTIKKSISDAKDARVERRRIRNEQIRADAERTKELAYLKQEGKYLKKEMKRAKREGTQEAKGMYSRRAIKSLTDEEIQSRLDRLQKESKLAEAELNRNPVYNAIREALIKGGSQAISSVVQSTLTDLGKKYLKVDMSTATKTTKEIETELRDKFNLQKLKDEMADYAQTREDSEVNRQLTRARNERDLIKAITEIEDYDQTRKDDDLKRQTQRAQNMRDLVSAKKSMYGVYKSAEDKSKDQQRRINERKELERRAKAFYNEGEHTYEEVARALGCTVSQAKNLLYKID